MKAVRIHEVGGADKLRYEDAPEPAYSAAEVLVRVKACAMNHLDIWVREGGREHPPLPLILGSDVAGVVEAVGSAVDGVRVGSKVMLQPGLSCGRCQECLSGRDNFCASYSILGARYNGGYAELVKAPAVNIMPMPENLSFEEAASIPLVFLTAWHMVVTHGKVRRGEDVLVHAAGSGVGIAAIQIAKLFGACVITTASTEEKLAKARELGADHTINYVEKDFYQEARNIVGRKGLDLVVDTIGGEVMEKSIRGLAMGGRLVTCGATASPTANVDIRYLYSRKLTIMGTFMGGKADLLEAMKYFPTGQMRPVVDKVFPLKDALAAHQHMADRKQFGKIVLVP